MSNGPGTVAQATLSITNLTWKRVDSFDTGTTAYFAEGSDASFTYHSDWLGTIEGPVGGVGYIFNATNLTNPFRYPTFFSIGFSVPAGDDLKVFSFKGGALGDGWTVNYGSPRVEDYGVLSPDAWQVAAVPEPETYGMLLAGLGLIGAVARRRRVKAA